MDNLITTSEKEEGSDVRATVKGIIDDLKSKKLANTPGAYSLHHYYI